MTGGDGALDLVLGKLEGVRQSGGSWMARCPAHDDAQASLSIKQGTEQPVILHCHAGCDTGAVLDAIGLAVADISAARDQQPADEWMPRDHDTGAFAVASIRSWREAIGQAAYPGARRLLITADSGGSNGSRLRLWKTELATFAAEAGLDITVLHLPPGTSKWNKIEHRLFSAITMNWRGRPLVSHEVIIETISAVTTRTGLKVTAVLDTGIYPKGIRILDKDMKAFEARHLQRHEFHGNWNYTIPAQPPGDTTRPDHGK
jgi:hypothetical protein